jgi:hypothetical protein
LADAVRQISVTVQTYYRWRKEYGCMSRDQLKRLKLLESENTRLRRAVSDLTLDKMILTEAAGGTTRPASTRLGLLAGCNGMVSSRFYSSKPKSV